MPSYRRVTHSALQHSVDFLLPISCDHESGSSRRCTSGYFLGCLNEQTKGADLSNILGRFRDLRMFGMDRHKAQSPRPCANRRLDLAEWEPLANAHINHANLALNNSFFLHHLVRLHSTHPLQQLTSHSRPLQEPQKSPVQNHESALTDKPHNPERTQTPSAIIAAQLGSLTTTSPPPRRSRTPLAAMRLRLARHGRPRPPRGSRHIRRRHAPRREAQTVHRA